MIIAIIDSGINKNVFEKHIINQYSVQAGVITEERARDTTGHGTSMLGIISENVERDVILSIRPVVCNGAIDNRDIAAAINFAISKGSDIISISMGTDTLKERECIEEACKLAYKNKIVVACAFSKHNDVILPWACRYAIKVMHAGSKEKLIQFKKSFFNSYMICVNKPMYRTLDNEGKTKMTVGHSAATIYIVGEFIRYMKKYLCSSIDAIQFFLEEYGILFDEKRLYNKVETVKGRIPYLDKKENCVWGAAAVIPYSKEMDSLVRFEDFGSYCIKVGVDYGKKGIQKVKYELKEIPIETSLDKLKDYDIETIIIGYLDKIAGYSFKLNTNNVLQFALSQNYKVFSFLPIPVSMKTKFEEKGLLIREAKVYDDTYRGIVNKAVPFPLYCKLPVLGVFGTSSRQGKFTLQMLIRRELKRRCISHLALLTEHQGELLDASICYPAGYKGEKNIQISIEDQIEVIQKSLYYLEQTTDAEMVLTGGQSWVIPYDIERQVAIYNLAFLEAIRPDFSVVVVNPEVDNMAYIRDTIRTLQSLYKVKIIAIAFSDKKSILCGRAILRKTRDRQNIEEVRTYLQRETGICAGCITDDDFIKYIVDSFIHLTD